jgi:hypothetical protein
MATIYLISTYEDLKAYCHVAFETQRKSGHHVLPMEDDIVTDQQRPVEKYLRDVEKSDLFVGVFAFRYGSVTSANQVNSDE